MNFLFLDCTFNMVKGSQNWDDYFSTSLVEQYSNIYRKMGNTQKATIENFKEFMNQCFNPYKTNIYHFSMPAFDRRAECDKKGNYIYRNVVIRPEKDSLIKRFLPDGQDVIIIGDIKCLKNNLFVVKGIELIDEISEEESEISVQCNCSVAYELRILPNGIRVPNFGVNIDEYSANNILINDFIYKLVYGPFYVRQYKKVLQTYEEWKDYILFRKQYLEAQSEKCIRFNKCEILNTFIIPRNVYRLNEERYSGLLLNKELVRDDQIVITENVDGAESFPLVSIEVDFNKKEIYSAMTEKDRKPKEELLLNRFTRQDISLTAQEPSNNQTGIKSIQLDERYKIFAEDILPNTDKYEKEFENDYLNDKAKVETQYNNIINDEVHEYLDDLSLQLDLEKNNKIKEFNEKNDISDKKNEEKCKKFAEKLEKEKNDNINKARISKTQELKNKYNNQINLELFKTKEYLLNIKNEKINKAIENETIRRFNILFKIEKNSVDEVRKELENIKPCFMTYNNIAEKMKIERQEKSLDAFFKGFVRNPYLSKYLFEPKSLQNLNHNIEDDIEWNLQSLNERQKEAVKKAVASESIFLLQGPPGTGKTQVIAEIIAQLTKKGKKILVSSETHKAIDNVFDRLPKIPEIRPLRLIPNINGKNTDYNPEKLVDNFYINISQKIDKQIMSFENFTATKENFDEEFQKLKLDYQKLLKEQVQIDSVKNQISSYENNKKLLNEQISNYRKEISVIESNKNDYELLIKKIVNYNFAIDENEFKKDVLERLSNNINSIIGKKTYFKTSNINGIMRMDLGDIIDELNQIQFNPELIDLENEKKDISKQIRDNLDEDSLEIIAGKETIVKELRSKLNEINEKIKQTKNGIDYDYSDLQVSRIIDVKLLNENEIKDLPTIISNIRSEVGSLVSNTTIKLNNELIPIQNQINEVTSKINSIKLDILQIDERISELREKSEFVNFHDLQSDLKQRINKFFKDFNIVKDYYDISEALEIIKEEWKELENNFDKKEKENKTLIPMYKKICKFLRKKDVIEEDRIYYTKQLFDNANVFGITCTSRDRFKERDLEELSKYNLGDLDVRTQGIDVVIIDEVSKSSFLDLLIPILYGKTIILVGDHRQLPPMYDLRNLKQSDIEGLDFIDLDTNKAYTELYEECFFKTLYEQVPQSNKIMLNQQYRCHEDIMRVFNHFYGGKDNKGLMLGYKKQNDEKQHFLNVVINGKTVIEQDKHIYFVNCDKHDFNDNGSTSVQNPQEADVVCELLNKINNEYSNMIKSNKIKVEIDNERNIDTRPSIGVICTYGDQAGLIKRKLKGKLQSYEGFSQSNDNKLAISTVDDFQGDERDIIILSMVRNPIKRTGNYDFIKKFERINVALSRARKLLIVVGNKDFLSNCGVINLPDIDGNKALDRQAYPVYKEIINTIDVYGKILQSDDIIKEDR
ncbi:MAG: AAA domain-containing protein [Firmicutes bacterium]|nr:AAA domain-containing protein [Bacillota bacterium]MCI7003146.1 AAA domain-containing protein [Clostridia bacterium]